MLPKEPTFGRRLAQELREYRRSHPNIQPEEFWAKLEELADYNLKLLSLAERPRFSKKETLGVLFDALAEATGKVTISMTKPEKQATAVALAQIRQASPDVTPFEIKRRARLYRQKWRDWQLTPNALCSHWSELGDGGRTASAKTDIYIEPPGWRAVAKELFPDAAEWGNPHDFDTIPWLDVSIYLRPKILAALQ